MIHKARMDNLSCQELEDNKQANMRCQQAKKSLPVNQPDIRDFGKTLGSNKRQKLAGQARGNMTGSNERQNLERRMEGNRKDSPKREEKADGAGGKEQTEKEQKRTRK